MGLVQHTGGYFGLVGGRRVALYRPDLDLVVPSVEAVGQVQTDANGHWKQMFMLSEPLAGYLWFGGLAKRSKQPIPVAGLVDLDLGPATGDRVPAEFFLYRASPLNGSAPREVPLTYPGGTGSRPVVIGTIADFATVIGGAISIATAGAFSGTITGFSARFEDGELAATPGWSINAATGVITGNSATATSRRIIVTAINAFGAVDAAPFPVVVAVDPLRVTTPAVFSGATPAVGGAWNVSAPTMAGDGGSYIITYRFYRDGVALGSFAAPPSYTFVAADQGHTITARYFVVGATSNGTYAATGSAAVPAAVAGPSVVGSIADVDITPGATITRTAAGVFSGTGTPVYSMTVDGLAPTTGYSISATTGVIVLPNVAPVPATGVASRTVVVSAKYPDFDAVTDTFTYKIAAALAISTAPTFGGASTAVGGVLGVSGQVVSNATGTVTFAFQILRDGVVLVAYGAASSYTIVAADQGKTLTANIRATDSSTPAQVATVAATGSIFVPGAVVIDRTVSTVAQLTTACQDLKGAGRKVIYITPGAELGDWTMANCFKTGVAKSTCGDGPDFTLTNNMDESKYTVITTDPRNPARFYNAQIALTNVSGLTFENILFENDVKDNADTVAPGVFPLWGVGTSGILKTSYGIVLRDLTTKGGDRNWVTQKITDLLIERCDFLACGMDDISLFNNEKLNITVRQSRFLAQNQINGRRATEGPRHPDGFSIQDGGVDGSTRALHCLSEDNIFVAENFYKQGNFWPNASTVKGAADGGASEADGHHFGMTIRGNWIVNRHPHGIYMGSAKGVMIESCYLVDYPLRPDESEWTGGAAGPPSIKFSQNVEGVVRNNAMCRAFNYDNGATAAKIAASMTLTNNPIAADGSGRPAALPNPPAAGPFSNIATGRAKIVAQYVIENIGTAGGLDREPVVHPLAVAGDRVYRFISQPKRAANAAPTTTINWADDFDQIGDLLDPLAAPGGADRTDFISGWAVYTLTAADIKARGLPEQRVGFHGMCTDTYVRGATGHTLLPVSRISLGRNCPLLPSAQTASAGLLLNAIAGSDYPNVARKARYGAASTVAGDAPWLIGQPAITPNQTGTGRWHGHIVNAYDHLGGTVAAKTITPVPALGADESITSWVLSIT